VVRQPAAMRGRVRGMDVRLVTGRHLDKRPGGLANEGETAGKVYEGGRAGACRG
jgi:hypothetical protein